MRHRGGVLIVTGTAARTSWWRAASRCPGVSVVQPAMRCERDAAAAADAAVELLRGRPGRTFAIRTTRRDKTLPAPLDGALARDR